MRHANPIPQSSCRAGASWLDVICVVGLIGGFILGLGVWALQPIEPRQGIGSQCKNNLKQWGLALHNYHDTHECFPPYAGGTAANGERLSGRAMLLPFLEQAPLWDHISTAPGQGGDPMKLTLPVPPVGEIEIFFCPSSSMPVPVDGQRHSSYAFNVGDQLDFGVLTATKPESRAIGPAGKPLDGEPPISTKKSSYGIWGALGSIAGDETISDF